MNDNREFVSLGTTGYNLKTIGYSVIADRRNCNVPHWDLAVQPLLMKQLLAAGLVFQDEPAAAPPRWRSLRLKIFRSYNSKHKKVKYAVIGKEDRQKNWKHLALSLKMTNYISKKLWKHLHSLYIYKSIRTPPFVQYMYYLNSRKRIEKTGILGQVLFKIALAYFSHAIRRNQTS